MTRTGKILLSIWLVLTGLVLLLNLKISGAETILAVLALAAGALILIGRGRVRLSRNLGWLLLGIWLALSGLIVLLRLSFSGVDTLLGLLALAAGILILAGGGRARLTRDLGVLALSIWLILTGLLALVSLNIPAEVTIMAVLAIAAGVLLWLRR